MKIKYEDKRFGNTSLAIIEQANNIIDEYRRQGFTLTLRQLYYQFVSRDLLVNSIQSYKRLGSIINDARMAGLVSWEAIEDRTRNLRKLAHWDSPEEIIRAAAQQYRIDMWDNQVYRPEVWIEKDALVGVIERICELFRVPYFACRGYNSQSEQWAAGRRFQHTLEQGQIPIVLHLGDHDPSGIDMTRDNADRLSLFAGENIEVIRLALNMDQIRKYSPPPNPAKSTDSRYEGYIEKYGQSSWELDALDPKVISDLIKAAIEEHLDDDLWEEARSRENAGRETALKAAEWAEENKED